jgi:hypothetical protein
MHETEYVRARYKPGAWAYFRSDTAPCSEHTSITYTNTRVRSMWRKNSRPKPRFCDAPSMMPGISATVIVNVSCAGSNGYQNTQHGRGQPAITITPRSTHGELDYTENGVQGCEWVGCHLGRCTRDLTEKRRLPGVRKPHKTNISNERHFKL